MKLILDEPPKADIKVSFNTNSNFTFSDFLSVFTLKETSHISLKSNVEESTLYQASEKIFEKYLKYGSITLPEFKDQILNSKLIMKDLFKMLLTFWVNRPLNIDLNLEKEMNNLSKVIYALCMSGNRDDFVVDYNCTSPFWTEIRVILENSPKPFPALIAAILCRSVAQRIEFEAELEESGASLKDDVEIWEKLSQENCEWSVLIGKLEDISLLNIILSNKPIVNEEYLPKLKHEKFNVSLKYVLTKGRGSVSELVAQWLSLAGIGPDLILLNDIRTQNEHHKQDCSMDVSQKQSKLKTPTEEPRLLTQEELEIISQPVFDRLNVLKRPFPYSLDATALLANLTWEYAFAWQKDIQQINKLEAAIKHLSYIPNLHVKQGLFNLVWNTHLKIIFESSCKLINKVGKLPKEKLCKQDTGLTDYQIVSFISICTEFFDSFMDVLQECCNTPKTVLHYEQLWENGPQPLPDLALAQSEINYDLLHLHHQLSMCMQMVMMFNIKYTKLMQNLFDFSVNSSFFTDFQNKSTIVWNKNDSKINLARTQFLVKVVTSSIETVSVTDDKVYSVEHVNWMARCLSLARVWNIDVDLLKRFQVVHLYNNGLDILADELLPAISEPNKIGPDLLVVCGKRLNQYMVSTQDLAEKIGAFSPALTNYLDKLVSLFFLEKFITLSVPENKFYISI